MVTTLAGIRHRAEELTLRSVLALPDRVQKVIAGRPVVRDGQHLDTETQLVLRLQQLTGEEGAEELEIPEGRRVLDRQSRLVAGRQPIGEVHALEMGGVPARAYVPRALLGVDRRPTLVFFHGGGFIYGGGFVTHDAPCRYVAERAGVQVLAVDYRLAPEHAFPAAVEDGTAAFGHVVEHADGLHVDPARIAVGGDSAGGNLAAVVAIHAAQEHLPLAFQLLVYPATDFAELSDSRRAFGEGFFLTTGFMDKATESYAPDPATRRDPRLSPLYADLPPGLAPAYVVTAGFDPLRDEGEAYARKLADAGCAVELERHPGLIHGFFNWVGVGRSARAAVDGIADALAAGVKA
jgi:acetyl esterase